MSCTLTVTLHPNPNSRTNNNNNNNNNNYNNNNYNNNTIPNDEELNRFEFEYTPDVTQFHELFKAAREAFHEPHLKLNCMPWSLRPVVEGEVFQIHDHYQISPRETTTTTTTTTNNINNIIDNNNTINDNQDVNPNEVEGGEKYALRSVQKYHDKVRIRQTQIYSTVVRSVHSLQHVTMSPVRFVHSIGVEYAGKRIRMWIDGYSTDGSFCVVSSEINVIVPGKGGSTVKEVKDLLRSMCGRDDEMKLCLYSQGDENDIWLEYYDSDEDVTINSICLDGPHLNAVVYESSHDDYCSKQIFCRPRFYLQENAKRRISVLPLSPITVSAMKELIQARIGLPAYSQRLLYGGVDLEDHRLLTSYDITQESSLQLDFRRNQRVGLYKKPLFPSDFGAARIRFLLPNMTEVSAPVSSNVDYVALKGLATYLVYESNESVEGNDDDNSSMSSLDHRSFSRVSDDALKMERKRLFSKLQSIQKETRKRKRNRSQSQSRNLRQRMQLRSLMPERQLSSHR